MTSWRWWRFKIAHWPGVGGNYGAKVGVIISWPFVHAWWGHYSFYIQSPRRRYKRSV